MNFTTLDIEKIIKCENATALNLSHGNFFVKHAVDNEMREEYVLSPIELGIRELAYSIIAKDIGLIAPDVYLVKNNEDIYVVTTNLNDLGKFNTLEDLGLNREASSSLYEIWDFLATKNGEKIKNAQGEIMEDLLKIYFLDIFLSCWDCVSRNIGLLEKDNTYHLVPFDNEYAFSNFIHNISSEIEGSVWFNKRKSLDRMMDKNYEKLRKEAIITDLKELLRTSSKETWDIFYNFYMYLTPEYIEYILTEIENNHYLYSLNGKEKIKISEKEILIQNYAKDYAIIKEAWKGLKSGR